MRQQVLRGRCSTSGAKRKFIDQKNDDSGREIRNPRRISARKGLGIIVDQNLRPHRYVGRSLNEIFQLGLHGTSRRPPDGFRRGVEVLGEDLLPAMTRSVRVYRRRHGRFPDLIAPKTFTEKQVLFKFFGLVPNPSPSDKLRSVGYVPAELRSSFELPRKIWVSDNPKLPNNGEVPDGKYYFKSNHSSGTNKPISYPISKFAKVKEEERARHWLEKTHNKKLSLWWYETMPRNIYFEEDLRMPNGDAPDWKFFVCNGRVEIFQVDTGRQTQHIQTVYERDGTFIDQELYFNSGPPVDIPALLPEMVSLAEGIGRNFDFIRVDMFVLRKKIYLGEIGLVPNGASTRIRSPELDDRLGSAWSAPWLGNVEADWEDFHYANVKWEPYDSYDNLSSI